MIWYICCCLYEYESRFPVLRKEYRLLRVWCSGMWQHSVGGHRGFGQICCLHLQNTRRHSPKTTIWHSLPWKPQNPYKTIHCHNSEFHNTKNYCHENINAYCFWEQYSGNIPVFGLKRDEVTRELRKLHTEHDDSQLFTKYNWVNLINPKKCDGWDM
jgi:hypothetical protein